jgi:hypothetical protein
LNKTASIPNVDVQLKVWLPLFHVVVIDPWPATVIVVLEGGSLFVSPPAFQV